TVDPNSGFVSILRKEIIVIPVRRQKRSVLCLTEKMEVAELFYSEKEHYNLINTYMRKNSIVRINVTHREKTVRLFLVDVEFISD
ncbi:hypothetical protein, partial [Enterobacter roggenkampii]|uniref:hypothetical protein n=1 Tax=Enterobacter roggenkampii TaxID=1812935 RepID=UPI002A8123F1